MKNARVSRGPGRPPKFGRPARAVTVTLPEDVITRLGAIDVDLGRAIVDLVEHKRRPPAGLIRPAELSSYGSRSVIVVPPITALKQIDGVELVPFGHNRALISLDRSHRVPELELDVRDALEHDEIRRTDRPTVEAVAGILQWARLSGEVAIEERTIIVLEAKRHRRAHRR